MAYLDTSADITLDNANEGIMTEDFKRWWLSSKYMQVVYSGPNSRQIACDGWDARQPEIDALKTRADSVDKDNALLIARIDPLKADNAALKAENERLRKGIEQLLETKGE